MTKEQRAPREFTGWHMLGVMGLFFGTIISVNLVMAWNASRSWSGLVVENTYIASQQFNGKVAETRAFAARGIEGALVAGPNSIRYTLTRNGELDRTAERVLAVFKRPVEEHEDVRVELDREAPGAFVAARTLKPGQWIADMTAMAGEEVVYRQAIRFVVPGERK
ncbi:MULTISPECIES: FixH family protein [unclassified Sinorhizobium]|uniref:FixH family protein n=1 Tax=unclassified Sinorhizobium TaxID=2613772 RepID=UPI0024C2E12A|nr:MULTISPECIES: FixH family protein [unclassified Sinorhizobium]MDK1373205.1 FixH family protein [Sinorhizobium sp. 6-70]MDK1480838.1 FixH family protein [Sinorhizobium sp. 6-117]